MYYLNPPHLFLDSREVTHRFINGCRVGYFTQIYLFEHIFIFAKTDDDDRREKVVVT